MTFAFHQRVAVMSSGGQHLRYVHGAMASAMVVGGAARVDVVGSGRIRAVVLDRPAETHATRIGPPTAGADLGGVRFYRSRRLDESASRVFEHHPRCLW
jgi:hypothetical protein